MKKLLLPLIALLLSVNVAFAQDAPASPWTHGGNVGFTLAQSHFDNWSAGGQDNINFLGIAKYDINFKKGKNKWENGIDLQLGYSYFDMHKKPVKTDDRIFISSLYGHDIHKDKWFLTANLTCQSQFVNGYDYASGDTVTRISGFMAPGYVTLGIGIQWVPNEHFKVNLAPLTGKMIVVNDQRLADAGAFGVKKAEYELDANGDPVVDSLGNKHMIKHGEKIRWELGAQLTAEFNYEIFKNVVFSSKLIAFYDYIGGNENALGEKYTCPVDFDWDNALIMKVNDWLSCNITARLVYDEDIKPLSNIKGTTFRQFKEVLSLGISYKIP